MKKYFLSLLFISFSNLLFSNQNPFKIVHRTYLTILDKDTLQVNKPVITTHNYNNQTEKLKIFVPGTFEEVFTIYDVIEISDDKISVMAYDTKGREVFIVHSKYFDSMYVRFTKSDLIFYSFDKIENLN